MLLPVSPYPSKGASALVGSTDLSLPRIMALTIIRPVSSLSFRGTLLQIAAECVDALDVGIPSEHEASSAANEGVELPSPLANPVKYFFWRFKKYRIGLDRAA